jgi:hypothetical protein
MASNGPTYTQGTSPPMDWDHGSRQQHANTDAYISQAQRRRRDIIEARAEAEENAKFHLPDVYSELLCLLSSVDRLARGKIARASYRHEWQGRWNRVAQFWESGNLARVAGRIYDLIDRFQDCEAEAAKLRELKL